LIHLPIVKKVRTTLLILIVLAVLIGIVLFTINALNPAGAGILIETNPPSTVFINGEQLGRTPYKSVRRPGEVIVKLIPDSFDRPLAPYETKINLVSGVETVIRREFAETEELSAGEVVSFEKTTKGEVGIALVSIPDSAQLAIDGQIRGFAPYKTSSISEGDHRLTINASGYLERIMDIKTHSGYNLTAVVKLAPDPQFEENQELESEIVEPVPEEALRVEILETGTGFLRVRSEPSTLSSEVGRVNPGETYVVLESDDQTGWYRIEIPSESEDGGAVQGWVSNQYAKEVGSSDTISITPTISPIVFSPTATPQ